MIECVPSDASVLTIRSEWHEWWTIDTLSGPFAIGEF